MKTLKALILFVACLVLIPLMSFEASAVVDLPQDAPTFDSYITSDDMLNSDIFLYWARFSPPAPGNYTFTMGTFGSGTHGGFSIYDAFGTKIDSINNTRTNNEGEVITELPYVELTIYCGDQDYYIIVDMMLSANLRDYFISVKPTPTGTDYTDMLELYQFKHIPADSEQQEFCFTAPKEGFYRFHYIEKLTGGVQDVFEPTLNLEGNPDPLWHFRIAFYPLAGNEYSINESVVYLSANQTVVLKRKESRLSDKAIAISRINNEKIYETIPDEHFTYTFDWTVIFKYTAPADGLYFGTDRDSPEYIYGNFEAIDCVTKECCTGTQPVLSLKAGRTYYIAFTNSARYNYDIKLAINRLDPPVLETSLSKSEMSELINGERYVKFSSDQLGSYTVTLGTFGDNESGWFNTFSSNPIVGLGSADDPDTYTRVFNYSGGDLYMQIAAHRIYNSNQVGDELDDYTISIEYSGKSKAEISARDYVYDGKWHAIDWDGTFYNYKHVSDFWGAVNVGDYTFVVELYPGFEWEDGTTDPKTFNWSITPAPATVKVPSKTIYVGDPVPKLDPAQCTITGLFGDDTIGTVELSYASEPDTSAAGTVAINAAITDPNANYEITVQAGTLTIINRSSPSVPSGGGGGSPEPEPEESVVENPDGSTTTTVTDPGTETVTETTIYKNGDTLVVETQKDGTVTKSETKTDGSKSETVAKPDGSSVSKVTTADGIQSESKKTPDGEITATVTLPDTPSKSIVLPIEPAPVGKSIVSIEAKSEVLVIIPAEGVTPGTVAVIVREDGTEEIVCRSVPTESGITLKIDSPITIKLVDNALEFDDVAPDAWYSNSVDFVSSHEIMNGVAERLFAPDDNMTRAMFTTTLARFDGQDTIGGETWYSRGQKWAIENAVSDGTNPDAFITREEMVTMLYRYAKSQFAVKTDGTDSISNFDDSAAISDWAQEGMEWAISNGIINGKTASSLDPQGLATRAEVSTILMRFCKLLAE